MHRSAMEGMCEACSGTGRFEGRFSGPEWPKCPACKGSGMSAPRKSLEDILFERLSKVGDRSAKQAEALEFIKEEFINALANLAAATSSYKNFVGNSKRSGVRDPLYNTRLKDYERAEERAREAYATFENMIKAIDTIG